MTSFHFLEQLSFACLQIFGMTGVKKQNKTNPPQKIGCNLTGLAAFVTGTENKWAKGRLLAMLQREVVHS